MYLIRYELYRLAILQGYVDNHRHTCKFPQTFHGSVHLVVNQQGSKIIFWNQRSIWWRASLISSYNWTPWKLWKIVSKCNVSSNTRRQETRRAFQIASNPTRGNKAETKWKRGRGSTNCWRSHHLSVWMKHWTSHRHRRAITLFDIGITGNALEHARKVTPFLISILCFVQLVKGKIYARKGLLKAVFWRSSFGNKI